MAHTEVASLNVECDGEELEIIFTGDFTPGRPAPNCSNHDSPAFSDSGDDMEFDVTSVECPDIPDWLHEKLCTIIEEASEE